MSKKFNSPEESAHELLERVYTDEITLPVDLDLITKHLSIQVLDDLSLQEKGVIGQICFKDGRGVVRINPAENTYEPRRRFTLAHEIGHFCLHKEAKDGFVDSRKTMSRSESYWDRYESEANSFAAALLMPEKTIVPEGLKIIATLKKDSDGMASKEEFIDRMARAFEVSRVSMEYRLKKLRALT